MEKREKRVLPEEKDILELLATFEEELTEKLQENKGEIERVKYYEKFQMRGIDFNNVFITTQKDVEGNISYHMYIGDSTNEILSIDSKGKIRIHSELEAYCEDIDLEQVMEENDNENDRLKGISRKMEPEEMKETLKNREKEQDVKQENEESLEVEGEDLEIGQYREIKDPYISRRMPEIFKTEGRCAVAYSNKLNRFVIVEKVNGKNRLKEEIEPAKTTYKSIISIGENGEKIEKKVPHALMKISGRSDIEIAITIGQYGEIDLETVQVLPCQERISRGVRMQGETRNKEESYQVRSEFETEGNEYSHKLAHNVNDIIESQEEATGIKDFEITESDYIPDTNKTWGELVDETGESLQKLIERYNKEMQKEGAESKKVVETIESDYENISHEHLI
ncbi:MAG: hypothetical protein HFJ55_06735 [Clostridia bacterium]|jgi:hypothetical protein|nr:hypothetical protein [Clostridia bacterium]